MVPAALDADFIGTFAIRVSLSQSVANRKATQQGLTIGAQAACPCNLCPAIVDSGLAK
jgi:hypothetical protein